MVGKDVWKLAIVMTLFVLSAGYLMLKNGVIQKTPQSPKTLKVNLTEIGKSLESGTAILTESNGKTLVSLDLKGEPKGGLQPAHIHKGGCPGVGTVVYPLSSVKDGKSQTTINTTLDQVMAQLPLAINVHKSIAESKVYVSCGSLTK